MMKYKPIYFYSEADKCYVAVCPELKGCMTDGETIEEALSNLDEVSEEWLAVNRDLGEPDPIAISDMSDIRTNPSVKDVAKFILTRTGIITTMALLKLVYYCQAWSYGWTGKPLCAAEFQAWKDGPVNPELFRINQGKRLASLDSFPAPDHSFSPIETAIMDMVLDVYDEFTGEELSVMTHHDAPWNEGRNGLPDGAWCDNPITPESLIKYYGKALSII